MYQDDDGMERGPYETNMISAWVDAGYFDEDTLVKRVGDTTWRKLGEAKLSDANAVPQPKASAALKKKNSEAQLKEAGLLEEDRPGRTSLGVRGEEEEALRLLLEGDTSALKKLSTKPKTAPMVKVPPPRTTARPPPPPVGSLPPPTSTTSLSAGRRSSRAGQVRLSTKKNAREIAMAKKLPVTAPAGSAPGGASGNKKGRKTSAPRLFKRSPGKRANQAKLKSKLKAKLLKKT